jgi:chlorite dismutase
MPAPLVVTFIGGSRGLWQIREVRAVAGPTLPAAERLDILEGGLSAPGLWALRGVVGNLRYTTEDESRRLAAVQAGLGRPEASRAALIPIRKSAAWWALAQDERRAIFEERSKRIAKSLEYLPDVARRLHHSRDLGEPFDFLTWFEFAPEHEGRFDDLVAALRETEEWKYVEREVDVRVERV